MTATVIFVGSLVVVYLITSLRVGPRVEEPDFLKPRRKRKAK